MYSSLHYLSRPRVMTVKRKRCLLYVHRIFERVFFFALLHREVFFFTQALFSRQPASLLEEKTKRQPR